MNNYQVILNQAINQQHNKPKADLLLEALLSAEKTNHQQKIKYQFTQLIGEWQLYFITGTKASRQKFGNFISSGFYIPPLIKITISYQNLSNNQGLIENKVEVGLVKFRLTGPLKYIERKNILAFDFTHLMMYILGAKVYETDVRDGVKSHDNFYQDNVKKQAFFSYFLVTDQLIAARGRGGGLALWKKD